MKGDMKCDEWSQGDVIKSLGLWGPPYDLTLGRCFQRRPLWARSLVPLALVMERTGSLRPLCIISFQGCAWCSQKSVAASSRAEQEGHRLAGRAARPTSALPYRGLPQSAAAEEGREERSKHCAGSREPANPWGLFLVFPLFLSVYLKFSLRQPTQKQIQGQPLSWFFFPPPLMMQLSDGIRCLIAQKIHPCLFSLNPPHMFTPKESQKVVVPPLHPLVI